MGREHEREQLTTESLADLATLLDGYATSLRQIGERMAEKKIDAFPVRHMPKGSLATKNLGEFVEMIGSCFREAMHANVFGTVPTRDPRDEKRRLKAAEPMQVYDVPGVQRSGKDLDKALKAAGVQKTPKPKTKHSDE